MKITNIVRHIYSINLLSGLYVALVTLALGCGILKTIQYAKTGELSNSIFKNPMFLLTAAFGLITISILAKLMLEDRFNTNSIINKHNIKIFSSFFVLSFIGYFAYFVFSRAILKSIDYAKTGELSEKILLNPYWLFGISAILLGVLVACYMLYAEHIEPKKKPPKPFIWIEDLPNNSHNQTNILQE